MKRIFQTDTSDVTGNCHQCCVASLFDIPLEEVPNFVENVELDGAVEGWRSRYIKFMREEGYEIVFIPMAHKETMDEFLRCNPSLECDALFAVESFHHERKHHCVVGEIKRGKFSITHDPNPLNVSRLKEEYRIVTVDLFIESDRLFSTDPLKAI